MAKIARTKQESAYRWDVRILWLNQITRERGPQRHVFLRQAVERRVAEHRALRLAQATGQDLAILYRSGGHGDLYVRFCTPTRHALDRAVAKIYNFADSSLWYKVCTELDLPQIWHTEDSK